MFLVWITLKFRTNHCPIASTTILFLGLVVCSLALLAFMHRIRFCRKSQGTDMQATGSLGWFQGMSL